MWRFLYSIVFHLCLPLILVRLWLRGKTEPGYRQHIGERFGLGDITQAKRDVVWIHAVSVGEVRAALPLIGQLRAAFPAQKILVTAMTPTGRRTARDLLTNDIAVAYLPYDLAWAMRRVITRTAPTMLIIMETELWPNLIASTYKYNVPTFLVNARLSEKSYQRYLKFAPIRSMTRDALQSMTMILAQSSNDAERFRSLGALGTLGAQKVDVTGNMKFDLTIDDAAVARGASWRALLNDRPVILLASTRDNEEGMLAEQFKLVPDWPQAWACKPLLVIVPRHPSRFDDVCMRLENNNFAVIRRSQLRDDNEDNVSEMFARADVLLGDSMGEMQAYYAMCTVAIIGGSFQPLGGQNLIEAAALAKPVIIGPSTFNFSDAVARAKEATALIQVKNAKAAMEAAKMLLTDEAKLAAMGENAKQFAAAHRGATGRTMAAICKHKVVD
jgi:3-deoxy-D-manno-octulosonic-acid transferase